MPTFCPGRRTDTFESRCVNQAACEVCECFGDRLLIDGVSHCVVWDREHVKYEQGSAGVPTSTIEICWPTCKPIAIKVGSKVIRNGLVYTVRDEPQNQHDGWTCTQLRYCGKC